MSYAFLSHRTTDKPRLREFVQKAMALNIPLWMDNPGGLNENLTPEVPPIQTGSLGGSVQRGSNWPESIDSALMDAFAIVLFWSNAWSGQRTWLAREHGVALARHRKGRARYFPVFLDPPQQLPEELVRYRTEAVDTVQGYNIAADGEGAWSELLKDLAEAWQTDWLSPFREKERSFERNVELLRRLPEGPGVDFFHISMDVMKRFGRGTTPLLAPGTVAQANSLVLTALGRAPKNPDIFTISQAELPAPQPLLDYWASVFAVGCPLGPRMIAALFLAAPPSVTEGAEDDFAKVLTKIQTTRS